MCGISGFISSVLNRDDLVKMTDRQSHRGPDAGGYFFENQCGLGHRRLSIIDLSDTANQPMTSHNEKYVIVFNGEIYNFKEIKMEIENHPDFCHGKTASWNTSSDTEVILEAFSIWGTDFVNRLNGMFAIAIYDVQNESLHLFRDRLGIKPIYYYHDNETFAFASELKSLTCLPQIKSQLSINKQAINQFLYLGYIPAPLSIYNEIRKFPQASNATFINGKLSVNKYWNIYEKIEAESCSDVNELKSRLKELLISSVKYRLISDVPYGTFLSGGIDSSLVTAVAQSVSSSPLNTFTIGFNQEGFKNEAPYAKKIADYLGTNHHEFYVTEKEALDLIPTLTSIYDEPYGDSSALPTLLVSKMAKQHVTMTLSGDGGDELFMGYGAYHWAEKLNKPLMSMFRNPLAMALSMGNNRQKRVAKLLQNSISGRHKSHIFSQEQYMFAEKEISQILYHDYCNLINFDEHTPPLKRKLDAKEQQALFDLNYYLPDDLLVKVDRASMQYALETRVPILDYRIVEFALNVNSNLKIHQGESKWLLKQVLYDFVPASYFERPKWGFGIPLAHWMKNELKSYMENLLFAENDVVNTAEVKKLYQRFLNGETYLFNRLWLISRVNEFLMLNK